MTLTISRSQCALLLNSDRALTETEETSMGNVTTHSVILIIEEAPSTWKMQCLGALSTMRRLRQPSTSGWPNRIVTGYNFLTPLAREQGRNRIELPETCNFQSLLKISTSLTQTIDKPRNILGHSLIRKFIK